MKTYGAEEIYLHHVPAGLPPGTHWMGGWVGTRADLEVTE
jgi:hypothetical protein